MWTDILLTRLHVDHCNAVFGSVLITCTAGSEVFRKTKSRNVPNLSIKATFEHFILNRNIEVSHFQEKEIYIFLWVFFFF